MTAPALAAARFGAALAVGAILGPIYDFLHPPGARHKHFPDLIFVIFCFWAWVYLSFGLCRGDLRWAYTAGMGLGFWLYWISIGKCLRPIFAKI